MTAPTHKTRLGALQATIWRNLGDKGNRCSVKLTEEHMDHA
jgi:hypothetical protein